MEYRILVLNFGSTSSKIALYEDEKEVCTKNFSYTREELDSPEGMYGQLPLRKKDVMDFLQEAGVTVKNLSAIVARAGATKPVDPGCDAVRQAGGFQ